MKRAERRCARDAEQIPSGQIAESESTVERTFSSFSGAKDTESRSGLVKQRRMGTECEGLETQNFKANIIEEFSLLMSEVGCGAI